MERTKAQYISSVKRIRPHVLGLVASDGKITSVNRKWNTYLQLLVAIEHRNIDGDYSRWSGSVKTNWYRGGLVYPQLPPVRKLLKKSIAETLKRVAEFPAGVSGWFNYYLKDGIFVEAKPAKV